MFKHFIIILLFLNAGISFSQKIYQYPNAPKESTTDIYFDTSIDDPYQWMENPNDPRLEDWLNSQKKIISKEKRKTSDLSTLRAQIYSLFKDVKKKTIDGYVRRDKESQSKYVFKNKFKDYSRFPDLKYKLREKGYFKTLVNIKDFKIGKDDNVQIIKRYVNE